MEYLFMTLIAALIIYTTASQICVLYYRHFKSFNEEIEKFLESHKYKLIEKRKPNNEDWKKSPFKKPSNFEVSLSAFTINGMPVTWTALKYKVIIGKNKQQTKLIWLEIKTTYFQKPQLKFVLNTKTKN